MKENIPKIYKNLPGIFNKPPCDIGPAVSKMFHYPVSFKKDKKHISTLSESNIKYKN